jgi:hypothetical protein
MNADFKIFIHPNDFAYFKNLYPYYAANYAIFQIPEFTLELTEKDFLFIYNKNDKEEMVLQNIQDTSFFNQSILIGKVFYVPIKDKEIFTTFEIPDFILYQHINHQNYQIYGIKINAYQKTSSNIVCFSLSQSELAVENEYYENNILYCHFYNKINISGNHYFTYMMNVIVNKEKRYGIVWNPKCGCTTITSIFCKINNIDLDKNDQKSLNFHLEKYRYNNYLQDIEFILFVRNPYTRFLSSYIDKHIYKKTDFIYPQLEGFIDYTNKYERDCIVNLCDYLCKGGIISQHYTPLSNIEFYQKYKNKLNMQIVKIEDGLNIHLYNFLNKYHSNIDEYKLFDYYENSIISHSKFKKREKNINSNLKFYNNEELTLYLEENNLDYDNFLDEDMKKLLFYMYQSDFINFSY